MYGAVRRPQNSFQQNNTNGNRQNEGSSAHPTREESTIGNKHARVVDPSTEEDEPEIKQRKQEPLMLPIEHYINVVTLLTRFKTKSTIWYESPEAERKKDISKLVQFRMRGNKLNIVYEDETTRDVLANEIDVASRFSTMFNATEASTLYELLEQNVSINDAVLRVINENTLNTDNDCQPLTRTISAPV